MSEEASRPRYDHASGQVWLLLGAGMNGPMSARLSAAFTTAFGPGTVVGTDDLLLAIASGKPLLANLTGRIIDPPHVAYARLSADRLSADREITLLRHLEAMGTTLVNTGPAYLTSANKFWQLQQLAAAHLPVPDTLTHADAPLDQVIASGLPEPCVVKSVRGNRGRTVFLAPTTNLLQDLHGCLRQDVPYLFQPYLASSHGRDLRIVVIDGQAVGAEERTNTHGGFKSNLAQGGTATPCPGRYPQGEELACQAATALGLALAGVDLLFAPDGGFTVCEVNPSPIWGEILDGVTPALLAACTNRLPPAASP